VGTSLHLLVPHRLLAGLTLLLLAASAVQCNRAPRTVTVQLLAINDFHSTLEPPGGRFGQIEGVPAGGAEYLATHVSQAFAENPNSLLVAAGDLIGAAPLVSALFHNEPTVLALNAMHMSISSVGNHEFDKGTDELLRIQHGGCHPVDGCTGGGTFPGAAWEYLSANVVRPAASDGQQPLFPATAIRTIGGVKIGFIGETLGSTRQMVEPAGIHDLTFLDEGSSANKYAAELKQQGVNAIVLLIHQGAYQTVEDSGDPNACRDFHGGIQPTLEKLSPDIKVVVSGHSHQAYNCLIDGRTVTSAASYGRVLTRLNLTIDRATDAITHVEARNEVVTRDVDKDAAQTAILARYAPLVAPRANREVGSVSAPLSRAANDAGESALGDVIADAQLAATAGPDGAVVAFMNPGGIRTDISSRNAPTAAGEITYGDLFTTSPYSNLLTVVTMTGDAVRRLLEQQFRPNGAQTVLQVSDGFSYRYSARAKAGEHVDPASITIRGKKLTPGMRVRIEASNFLIDGGDGFTIFAEGTDRRTFGTDVDALVDYFKTHSPVAPGPQNRIVRVP
jgi:5'-nucleotidase